ncbi:MAG: cell division protein FtsA [Bacteroidetes bacterium]|nr:cell division protein FtsA [Bacteroidota bacterium]MBU1116551.1 cell division protein FtsA [Bacteroidota bacterium]MBU1797559.1 cell division protein FtsA [Bacteroidota bacterium]
MKNNIIVGLDLGTTKVCAVIAEQTATGLKVLGFGVTPSDSLNKGLVANIAKTSQAISEALEVAQNRAGIQVKELNVGVAGEHITSLRHRNFVTISGEDDEISQSDLDRLKADVRTLKIPVDRQILHIIPEEFSVDYQGGIDNPIGMCGSRLEAVNHVVLAAIPAIQNIKRSVEKAGYVVKNYILQPIASSVSVLEDNEKDLGVLLIDIGGGTTDIAIFHDNSIKHTKVFGVAGNQVTNDIRESLGIVTADAEQLKKDYGYATQEAIIKEETIYIKGVGARGNVKIPVTLLTQIISVRMKELFALIDNELRQSGLKGKIKAGVVLTGGGALLRGCTDLAESVLGLPCRIGVPLEFGEGLSDEIGSPEFATVSGLIKGVPGSTSSDTWGGTSTKAKKGSVNIKGIFKKVIEFFDEL